MKVCKKVLDDLNFEPTAIQPCCNTSDIPAVPSFSFAGGTVDLDAYKRHIIQSLQAMQQEDGLCAGCPERVDMEGDADTYRQTILDMLPTLD